MEQAAYLTWIIQRVIYHGVVFADSTESDDKDIDHVACFSEELTIIFMGKQDRQIRVDRFDCASYYICMKPGCILGDSYQSFNLSSQCLRLSACSAGR